MAFAIGSIFGILGNLAGKLNQHQRQRIEDAEALLARTTKENEELRIQVSTLEIESDRLQKQIAQHQQVDPEIPVPQVILLRRLVKVGSQDSQDLAIETQMEHPVTLYHLEKLESRDLVWHDNSYVDGTDRWEATPKGRAYLIENNLF